MVRGYSILRFEVSPLYHERELEELLEILERRGAEYTHCGDGFYELRVPYTLPWIVFYDALQDSDSVRNPKFIGSASKASNKVMLFEPRR